MFRFAIPIVLTLFLAAAAGESLRRAAEGRRLRRRRLAAGRQPAGLRPDQGGGPPALLPGGRPDRRGAAGRALRRRLDRDRQRRPGRVPQGAGRGRRDRPRRVAVHTLHQHDAPICDFSADRLLAEQGINREVFDAPFARDVIARAADGGPRRRGEGAAGHPPGAGPGRGREGGVEPPHPRPRRQGQVRPLHRLQGPGDPGHAGRDDRPDAQDDQLLGRRRAGRGPDVLRHPPAELLPDRPGQPRLPRDRPRPAAEGHRRPARPLRRRRRQHRRGQVERRLAREPPGPGRPRRRRDGQGVGGDREDPDHGRRPGLGVGRRRAAARPAPRRGAGSRPS